MIYEIIRTKNNEISRKTVISGSAHEVKSIAGKEFQADPALGHIQVLEEGYTILMLQKDTQTGKMINRFSA